MRGATSTAASVALVKFLFQSTRPMRGATGDLRIYCAVYHISIHAPHAGRDQMTKSIMQDKRISIHAPHAGRD